MQPLYNRLVNSQSLSDALKGTVLAVENHWILLFRRPNVNFISCILFFLLSCFFTRVKQSISFTVLTQLSNVWDLYVWLNLSSFGQAFLVLLLEIISMLILRVLRNAWKKKIIGGTGTRFRIVRAAKLNNHAQEARFSAASISKEMGMVLAPSQFLPPIYKVQVTYTIHTITSERSFLPSLDQQT